MKKNIYIFLKEIIKLVFSFAIVFFSVTLSSNDNNFIYKFVEQLGYTEKSAKQPLLSAFVALALGALQLLFWLLIKGISVIIERYFKKLDIKIFFRVNGKKCANIVFKPVGGIYEEKEVNVVLEITPAGRLSMFFFKILNVKVELFFNPKILDLTLKNDSEWMGGKSETVNLDENQLLRLFILKDYELGGTSCKSFKKTETLIVVPKRVKEDTANIDYKISTVLGKSRFSKNMYDIDFKNGLSVNCKGEK